VEGRSALLSASQAAAIGPIAAAVCLTVVMSLGKDAPAALDDGIGNVARDLQRAVGRPLEVGPRAVRDAAG
jgi:hypothetical protein